MDLVAELRRSAGPKKSLELLESAAAEVGVPMDTGNRALVALALCKGGMRPEDVSAQLTWKEFESFCSDLFAASGFEVKENVVLTKPRVQIDMVALGPSLILSVDCKHWKASHSPSMLEKFAVDQLKRSSLLRKKLGDPRPIASAIISFSELSGSFVDGVAVVPLRTLRSFLSSVEAYSDLLSFR